MNTTMICKVAGVTFEGRQSIIEKMVGNEVVQLRPEPLNQYDQNAIAVWVAFPPESGLKVEHIGYLPREIAAEVSPALEGENLICQVDAITGGFTAFDGEVAYLGVLLKIEIDNA